MSPVQKLVSAILLSAEKKRAQQLRIRPDGDASIVEFLIDGETHEELRPPPKLHQALIQQFIAMANMPQPPDGRESQGYLHLMLGEDRHLYFAVRVFGRRDARSAELRVITGAEMPRGQN